MTEPTPPPHVPDATAPGATPSDDDEDPGTQNRSLGIVFGMLGIALMVALDDTRAAGLPFLVLGITFFVMGVTPRKAPQGSPAPAAPGTGTPPPDGAGRPGRG